MRNKTKKEPSADARCATIAARQHSVISRKQACATGLSRDAISRRVRAADWQVMYPGVYRMAGVAVTWEQRLMGAHLWCGTESVASHRAAAALFALDGSTKRFIELTLPGRFRPPLGRVIVHRTETLAPGDRAQVQGIPCTSATRTLIDLGAVATADDVEDALESALRMGLTSIDYLQRRLELLGGKGRRGAGVLRAVLARRDATAPATGSLFETWLNRALRRAKVRLPERQVKIFDAQGFIAQVDFAYPDSRLIIEADSYKFHSGRDRWDYDINRRNRLTLAGWRILQVTWGRLCKRPREVAEQVREALAQAERRR